VDRLGHLDGDATEHAPPPQRVAARRGAGSAAEEPLRGGIRYDASRSAETAAITALLEAGAAAGTLRPDVQPSDVLASLSGVSLVTVDPAPPDQARRILDLLIDGLRYRAAQPSPR
jgi:hypothetical protein